MKQLASWVKGAIVRFVDPEHEDRVAELVRILKKGIQAEREQFSLSRALAKVEYSTRDLDAARERVFRAALDNVWRDEQVTRQERELTGWVARVLEIRPEAARKLDVEYARERFAPALAAAMEDGHLDEHEEARLAGIAAAVGMTVPQFVRAFFQAEGEGFLRGIFLACVDDNQISQKEWNHLLSTTAKLGISRQELLETIQPQAEQFVEHVLADAKADGRLSNREESTLHWLLDNLVPSAKFRRYVSAEVAELRLLTDIDSGKLPSIAPPLGVAVRAGEIVHFVGNAGWRETRMLKSGPRTNEHAGTLVLTDNRLLFSSATKSENVGYRKVIAHRERSSGFELEVTGKPAYRFLLSDGSAIAYAIFRSALAMANQTLVARIEGTATRHIPRDVRQRVWQRYGGRCAECGASDYLEFDHIVPVAKGGSNSDANVQLLCRRCNLKKSDAI